MRSSALAVQFRVLHALSERGITRLMVEGGARVASSFVAAGLVDEVWLLRGADAVGAVAQQQSEIIFLGNMGDAGLLLAKPAFLRVSASSGTWGRTAGETLSRTPVRAGKSPVKKIGSETPAVVVTRQR